MHLATFFLDDWFWHPLRGLGYQWWSGIGSDLGEITLLVAIVAGYRKINCHAKGCLRLSKYPVEGTPYKTCSKHHPHVPAGGASAEHISGVHDVRHLYATGKIEADELEARLKDLHRKEEAR